MSCNLKLYCVLDSALEISRNVFCQKVTKLKPVLDSESVLYIGDCFMPQNEYNLDMVRGMYKEFAFILESQKDISDAVDIVMTVKQYPNDTDTNIILQKSYDELKSDLAAGKIVFKFTNNDTKNLDLCTYYYDVQLQLTTEELYQVSIGSFILQNNIYRRI